MKENYESKKPTKRQFIIPSIIFILCICTSLGLFLRGKQLSIEPAKTYFLAPGSTQIELNEIGHYNGYLILKGSYEGKQYTAAEDLEGLDVKINKDSQEVVISNTDLNYVYNRDGESGETYFSFYIEEAGKYSFITTLNNEEYEEVILAVGLENKNMVNVFHYTVGACLIGLVGIFEFIGYMLYGCIRYIQYYRLVKS